MAQTIATITLDVLIPSVTPVTVYAKQLDKSSRYVRVRVTDNGTPMPVASSSTVYLGGTRSDKRKKSFAGSVDSDGTLMFLIDSWLLQLAGSVECDVLIQAGGVTLTTMSFMLVVRESSFTGDDSGEDDSSGTGTPILPQYDVASLDEVKSYLGA